MITALLIGGLIVAALLVRFWLGKPGKFWRIVGRHPDRALAAFRDDPDCVVDQSRPPHHGGPFTFMNSQGVFHTVWIAPGHILDVERRIGGVLKSRN